MFLHRYLFSLFSLRTAAAKFGFSKDSTGHTIFSFYANPEKTNFCPRYAQSRQEYCNLHNYTCEFELMRFENHDHFQEALGMRIYMAMMKLQSAHVKRLTYMDADTLIIQPEVKIEDIFREEESRHDFPCTVLVQADPYLVNSGFFSIVNTRWTRNVFLPLWLNIYTEWQRLVVTWLHEPDQKSLVAAITTCALRFVHPTRLETKGDDSMIDFCQQMKPNPKSYRWRNISSIIAKWVSEKKNHPPKEYWIRPKQTTYQAMLKRGGDKYLPYLCFNYVMQELFKKANFDYSFRVSDHDGICFMGFEGTQVNRQHFIPENVASKVPNLNLSYHNRPLGRHAPWEYGSAYSKNVFMLHAHLEKFDECFCIVDPVERKICSTKL